MVFVGIDAGKKGALSVIYENGDTLIVPYEKNDYINTLRNLKTAFDKVFVVIEQVHSMPKQGVASTFTFGEGFGWLQGVCDALKVPYELVRPQKWKAEFSVTSDKNTSIEVAKRLFPNASLKRTERSHKDDDNIAESLLMAEYGRRKYKEN